METHLGFYWVSWFSYFEPPQRSQMNPDAIPKATHLLGARPNGSCRNAQAAWHFIVTSIMARNVRKSETTPVRSNKNSFDTTNRGPIISMIPSCRTHQLKSKNFVDVFFQETWNHPLSSQAALLRWLLQFLQCCPTPGPLASGHTLVAHLGTPPRTRDQGCQAPKTKSWFITLKGNLFSKAMSFCI